jgi:hypothetical protein
LVQLDLTKELLDEVSRADTSALAKLFGSPSSPVEMLPEAAMAVAATRSAEPLPAEPGPTWTKPGACDAWRPKEPVWDANSYRISPPHRSGFSGEIAVT